MHLDGFEAVGNGETTPLAEKVSVSAALVDVSLAMEVRAGDKYERTNGWYLENSLKTHRHQQE